MDSGYTDCPTTRFANCSLNKKPLNLEAYQCFAVGAKLITETGHVVTRQSVLPFVVSSLAYPFTALLSDLGPNLKPHYGSGMAWIKLIGGELARPERFELPTPRFEAWCSIQLSYGRRTRSLGSLGEKVKAPSALLPTPQDLARTT